MSRIRRLFACVSFIFLLGMHLHTQTAANEHSLDPEVKKIITGSCITCHSGPNPSSKLDLVPDTLLRNTVMVKSTQQEHRHLVVPGEAKNSYLFQKISGDSDIKGEPMPFKKPPLEKSQIKLIKKWIYRLAEKKVSPTSSEKTAGPQASFDGTQLINLPTTATITPKHVLFKISHRFEPTVESGSETFFGWDGPANILFSLGYGISSNMDITLSRSNRLQEWEILYKWRIFNTGYLKKLPVDMSLGLGANWISQEIAGRDRDDTRNLRYFVQISFGWPLLKYLTLIISPTFIANIDHLSDKAENLTALNAGVNLKLFRGFSLLAEWLPALSGPTFDESGWGFGFQYITGKHIFHLTISNGTGLTTGQYLRGSMPFGNQGNIRFGFNIFREF